jgi:hypothetical protein
MPKTEKGEKIAAAMKEQYGAKKGEQVFYASKNAGKITGVDEATVIGGKETKPPSMPETTSPSTGATLPTKDVFRRRVTDAVRAGLPMKKVMEAGTTWGSDLGKSNKNFQGYSNTDKATFRKAFRDAINGGAATHECICHALGMLPPAELDLGATSGRGQPMPEITAEDQRHFFKGAMDRAMRKKGIKFKDAIAFGLDLMKWKDANSGSEESGVGAESWVGNRRTGYKINAADGARK